jgi:hypothetical protein
MNKEKFFISEALCLPPPAIEYHVGQDLAALFPDKAMIEGEEGFFNIEEFARAEYCTIRLKIFTHNQVMTYWVGPEPQAIHYLTQVECDVKTSVTHLRWSSGEDYRND